MASGGSDTEEAVGSDDSQEFSEEDDLFGEDMEPDQKPVYLASNFEKEDFSAIKENLSFAGKISCMVAQELSRSIFASLLNDYVESEFFVIHGDSLLITCATNNSLTLGESLHFFFLLERFLFNLTNKNGKYIIVFFEDFEYLHCPLMRCWRMQIMLHLQENSSVAVHTFSSFLCEEWKAFLKEQAPYFFMVSDQGMNKQQTLYLNMLTFNVLGSMVNVVLTAGQESDNLRVNGYYVKSRLRVYNYLNQNIAIFEKTLQELVTSVQKNEHDKLISLLQHVDQEKQVQDCILLLSMGFKEQCDIRAVTCVASCSIALKIHANNEHSQHQNNDLQLTLEEAADLCRMKCLCVALMILLPLSQRAKVRQITGEWKRDASMFLHLLQQCEHVVLGVTRDCCKKTEINFTCVSDISDYLLLKNIAYYCEKEYNSDLKLEFGKAIEELYTFLWTSTIKLFSQGEHINCYDLRTTKKHFLSSESCVTVDQENILPVGLIPMQSDIIEDYAGDAIQELPILHSDDTVVSGNIRKMPYDELRHWHSGRLLSDDFDRTKHFDDMKDKWALKQYQKNQAFNNKYGQSLGVKTSKQIVVEKNKPEEKSSAHRVTAKKKTTPIKKKEQIIEQNLKKTRAIEESKEQQQLKTLALFLEKEIREDFSSGILKMEKFIKSLHTRTVKYHAQLRALTLCFEVWIEHCKTKSEDERDMDIVVEIMKIVQQVLTNHYDMLQGEDKRRVIAYLDQLGFQNLSSSLRGSEVLSKNEGSKSHYVVGVGSARFQMKYMGPYLQKDERKDPDPRVQHFIPDTWQRKLLDVVDNNESAVIVAPTSSGKTYASYYCMEKVLKQSNESVVVYVAPTKPLVNQVVATVKCQFDKDLPKGKVLCGVFTRDYRTDALNCQVLVTVPQCLEILLLSPHRQDWAKQIKYVIFDEVHCLGGEIGAEVWEHLLVMIRCPFLALSATINNPEHLTEWLQSVREYWQQTNEAEDSPVSILPKKGGKKKQKKGEKKSYRVRLVRHDKRYNDLETHICSLQDSDIKIQHCHPFAALTLDHLKNYGIPGDLTFSPRESIQLYDTMVEAWPTCANIKYLDPEENVYLKNKFITKCDAFNYEDALKKELIEWVEKGHQEKVSKVLNSLNIFKLHKPMDERSSLNYFPQLVEKLGKLNKLPALFFAFQLDLVEDMAKSLNYYLREKQRIKQYPDVKEVQKLTVKAERLQKSIQGSSVDLNSKSATTLSKQESLVAKITNYESIKKKINKLTETPPDCTYANLKAVDRKMLIHLYRRMTHSKSRHLIFLSQRGIGYHHSSVDARGRSFVEMLFRMGYIKVVTATGTLALGINMPCKSVVFLHDSIYLDALNYRQMAGRAGRRGLDLEGSVYFFNIPIPKVKKLMKSNVPELRGQFPLSISLVLRLMLLASKADDKEDARAKVLSVLKHSLMTFKQPQETRVLKLYFVFSLQFLLFEGYLDSHCSPTEFTGLVTHLHYHEPSNFVFVIFLEKGLFHQLCKPVSKDVAKFSDYVMETLVLILANLFGRCHCPPRMFGPGEIFFQSKVFLDKLPDDFAKAVEEYNTKVAKMFGHCILSASKLADMEKEYRLPLTEISFSGQECVDSALVNHLMPVSEGRNGISPFACLSGNTDHDLMKMANSSLMLQTVNIPDRHIPLLHLEKKDICGRKMFLNSYALDFFKHGSLPAIVTDNGFNRGNAYFRLRDFYLAIASISVSLRELCEDEYDPVVLAFEQLRAMYDEKLEREYL